ncbi:MAG TPA: glycosyltransferase, partial [Opitutaceae bacterium]
MPPKPAGSDGRDERPLVSCIMPTYNRRRFAARALRCFLGQDYPEKELVIIDDGTESLEDLVPRDPRIRYTRLDARM